MKDTYPPLRTVPSEALVAPEAQPDYLEGPPGFAACDVATAILRPPAYEAERAGSLAMIHHECGEEMTFGQLDRAVSRLASVLVKLGISAGDRVAFRSANRPEGIITALAAWRCGAVVVPIPLLSQAAELDYLLRDTGASLLVSQSGDALAMESLRRGIAGTDVRSTIVFGGDAPAGCLSWTDALAGASASFTGPAVDPDSVAIIWHTGGTTGVPKACYHTHRRFITAGYAMGAAIGVTPGERWAAAAPIGHALGFIYHTIYTLLHGATIVLVERFQLPEVLLHAIARHDVGTFTAIAATWAQMRAVVESDAELTAPSNLRRAYAMWQSASSTEIYDWWARHNVTLMNNFGSTAFAAWVLLPHHGDACPPGWLGRPAPGYEVIAIDPDAAGVVPVAVCQPGRMAVRGPTGLTYWNRPELQLRDVRDGWTLVDDVIEFNKDGYARYLGRTDFLISTAGYKVAPVEVEAALASHPAVREVAVIGTPDPIRSQVVSAFVVLSDGVMPTDGLKAELKAWVKSQLAPYKYPRRIEFIRALPRDSVGKVQPRRLLEADDTHAAPGLTGPR